MVGDVAGVAVGVEDGGCFGARLDVLGGHEPCVEGEAIGCLDGDVLVGGRCGEGLL